MYMFIGFLKTGSLYKRSANYRKYKCHLHHLEVQFLFETFFYLLNFESEEKLFVLCRYVYSVISFATVYLYLQYKNTEISELVK
jgi:hypothetical protein